jgi:hypothetical protein
MSQPARNPMPFDGRAHRLPDNQPDTGTARLFLIEHPPRMDHDVRLHRSNPKLHGRVEVFRPLHAVARGKHRFDTREQIKQSTSDAPCVAGSTRWHAPRGYASAAGNHAPGLGAGCSAEKSACPWSRLSPRSIWHRNPTAGALHPTDHWSVNKVLSEPPWLTVSLVSGAVSGSFSRIAAVSPTFGRLFEGTERRSRGQTPLHHDKLVGRGGGRRASAGYRRRLEQHLANLAERLATHTETC